MTKMTTSIFLALFWAVCPSRSVAAPGVIWTQRDVSMTEVKMTRTVKVSSVCIDGFKFILAEHYSGVGIVQEMSEHDGHLSPVRCGIVPQRTEHQPGGESEHNP